MTGDCPVLTGDCRVSTGGCPVSTGDCPVSTGGCHVLTGNSRVLSVVLCVRHRGGSSAVSPAAVVVVFSVRPPVMTSHVNAASPSSLFVAFYTLYMFRITF